MALNMCMLGAVLGLTLLVRIESVLSVLKDRIPHRFLDMNTQALNLGLALVADSPH